MIATFIGLLTVPWFVPAFHSCGVVVDGVVEALASSSFDEWVHQVLLHGFFILSISFYVISAVPLSLTFSCVVVLEKSSLDHHCRVIPASIWYQSRLARFLIVDTRFVFPCICFISLNPFLHRQTELHLVLTFWLCFWVLFELLVVVLDYYCDCLRCAIFPTHF